MTERTLVLIKPDGVQRLLVGRIIDRYEQRGLKLVGLKLIHVDRDLAERHYAVHREKPFFGGLVDFITSAPLVAIALEGLNAIAVCRAVNGATKPVDAAPGTIRGDFALETGQNLVHASDSAENAEQELALWFSAGRAARLRARHRHLGGRPGQLDSTAGPSGLSRRPERGMSVGAGRAAAPRRARRAGPIGRPGYGTDAACRTAGYAGGEMTCRLAIGQ